MQGARALRRELEPAGRLRVPFPGHLRQPPCACTRAMSASASIRSSPRASRRPTSCSRSAPRLGEMTTGGYTLLQPPRPAQKLIHVHAGAEELGRVYAADLLLQSSMACAAKALETIAPPPELPWGAWTASAHEDYVANQTPTPVEPLDMAEVVFALGRLAPGCDLHQRRGQLQRLAASLPSLSRAAAPRPHAARADLGRDGLWRAGRGGREPAVPAAHRRQPRR